MDTGKRLLQLISRYCSVGLNDPTVLG